MRILLLSSIFVFSLTFNCFAQPVKQTGYVPWEHPVLKQLAKNGPGLIAYSDNTKYINLNILDTATKIMYCANFAGYVIDAYKLSDTAYNRIISKRLSPFKEYQNYFESSIELLDAAITKLRFPKLKARYKGIPEYDDYVNEIYTQPTMKKAKTLAEKLTFLYSQRQEAQNILAQSKAGYYYNVIPDTAIIKELEASKSGQLKILDSLAEFYNPNIMSPVYKAKLDLALSKLYFYLPHNVLFDSLHVNPKNQEKLVNEKTNVFILYQNYQLWQLAQLDSAMKLLIEGSNSKNAKVKKAVQQLLNNYGNKRDIFIKKLPEMDTAVAHKVDMITGVDENYAEQRLMYTLNKQHTFYPWSKFRIDKNNMPVFAFDYPMQTIERGNTHYQLTDHRGNVMTVVTDKKIPHDDNHDGIVDRYTPDVVKATDYSSFGAPLPGRTYQIAEYRYGYNGKEKDKETGYDDYGSRMYDANIGRFLSIDPKAGKYPSLSPYLYAANNPILMVDQDGQDAIISITRNKDGGGIIKITTVIHVNGNAINKQMSPSIIRDYNAAAKKTFQGGSYKDKNGGVWKEVFDVKYVYDKDMTKEKLPSGHNLLVIDKSNSNIKDGRAITKGDAIYMLPKNLYDRTSTHETGHALGLTDRYSEFRFKDANGDIQTGFLPHKGYNENLMGFGTEINQAQIDNWGEQLLNKSTELGKDNFVLKGMIEYKTDESGRNLRAPYTEIDPQEKQDYIDNFNKNLKPKNETNKKN